jgi:hypothetical protein
MPSMIAWGDFGARLDTEDVPVRGHDLLNGLAVRQVQGASGHAEPQVARAEHDQP